MFKTVHKLFLLLIMLLLSGGLFWFADLSKLSDYNSSLVSMSLGVATFSISFSFLQYQFSPYKALLRTISRRHLLFCYLTVLIALIPLAFLIIDKTRVPASGIFCIPLLVYSAIFLPIIANEETDPVLFLKQALKTKCVKAYLQIFKAIDTSRQKIQKRLDFSWPNETPMHDYSSKYGASLIKGDPFALIRNIVELALKNGDQSTFEQAVRSFFTLTDRCIAEETVDYKSGFRFSVNTQIKETFEIILGQVVATNNTPLTCYLIYATGDIVKEKSFQQLQTRAPFDDFVQELVSYAKTAMDINRDGVVYISSLCRQLAQKGIYEPEIGDEAMFFKNHLTGFAHMIKAIGQEAVKQKNSDILFRCLEDLGFLGCTAVKQNHFHLIIECLQGLVQLGREAEANEVKCFWRHCALDVVDHAEQRIDWMVTWLPGLPEKDRKMLAESFSTAYSRLHGIKWTISYEQMGDKLGIRYIKSEDKHVESYADGKFYKTVDYSNKQEIKEFKLY
jgi:hypothetical protein